MRLCWALIVDHLPSSNEHRNGISQYIQTQFERAIKYPQLSLTDPTPLHNKLDEMAHSGHGGSTTTASSSNDAGIMIPYFHFTLGDSVLFAAWRPRSAGALAGACFGLIVLCLFERWLAAARSVFNAQWRQRSLIFLTLTLQFP